MSQETAEIVRRWWEGFNEDGMPPLALCDEAIQIRNPPDLPISGLFEGHDGVRRWCDQTFEIIDTAQVMPEDIVDVHGDGTTVLMLLRITGTASHTGIVIDYEWAAVWTIRDGKLLRAQGYLNRADAVEAAGLSK